METEEIKTQDGEAEVAVKPLSKNGFVALFGRLRRWWLGVWYDFSDKHRRAAAIIYKIFFFLVFSIGVTIWQYIVMTFLPYAFSSLNDGAWGWPDVPLPSAGGVPYMIFGDASGLGWFIAFEIAVFTAQCINFPLQRNITYKSHGNPAFQALWYFIGWALVSVFTNALWGLVNCYFTFWGVPDAVGGLVKTLMTGLVSLVIFFFIFMIIFPDRQKQALAADKKLNRLTARGITGEKLEKARGRRDMCARLAELESARKDAQAAASAADAKAVAWEAAVRKLEKLKSKRAPEPDMLAQGEKAERRYGEALAAAKRRDTLAAEYDRVLKKYASGAGHE